MTATKKKAKAPTLAQRLTATNDHADYLLRQIQAALVSISSVEQRMAALEAWQRGERARSDYFAEHITALEQAQRPTEKPTPEKCTSFATNIVSWECHHRMLCNAHLAVVMRAAHVLGLAGVTQQSALDARVTCAWPTHAPPVDRRTFGEAAPEKRAGPWEKPAAEATEKPASPAGRVVRFTDAMASETMGLSGAEIEQDVKDGGDNPVVVAQRMRSSLDAMVEDARLRDAVVEAALAWGDYAQSGTEMGEAVLRRVAFTGAVAALRAHRAKKGGA